MIEFLAIFMPLVLLASLFGLTISIASTYIIPDRKNKMIFEVQKIKTSCLLDDDTIESTESYVCHIPGEGYIAVSYTFLDQVTSDYFVPLSMAYKYPICEKGSAEYIKMLSMMETAIKKALRGNKKREISEPHIVSLVDKVQLADG